MSKVICPESGSQLTIGSVTFGPQPVGQPIPATAPGRFTPTQADSILIIARLAICSLGSYDRGLQDHYQRQLDAALNGSHAASERK